MSTVGGLDLSDLRAIPIEGRFIRLEPLTLDHASELFEVGKDPLIWKHMTDAPLTSVADARDRIKVEIDEFIPFAIRMQGSGAFAGCVDYRSIEPDNGSVEIGWLWLGGDYRGTLAGPEALYLLAIHAFEVHGAGRVWTETDARNKGSNGSLVRFGLTYEGCLRRHLRLNDGFVRDTNIYSIIVDEWPQFKERVEGFVATLYAAAGNDWGGVAGKTEWRGLAARLLSGPLDGRR